MLLTNVLFFAHNVFKLAFRVIKTQNIVVESSLRLSSAPKFCTTFNFVDQYYVAYMCSLTHIIYMTLGILHFYTILHILTQCLSSRHL